MKIFVTGTRGIPDVPGGVEKHCQELYPRIAALGHEVQLATRSPYIKVRKEGWCGVKLEHLFAPKLKSFEAIIHTFISLLKARSFNPDIIHIHAVGPGLMVPLARIMGMRVVATNHGPDYDRQKWGRSAKVMLKLGEYLSGKFSNETIAISQVISDIIEGRCGRKPQIIYNGVPTPPRNSSTDYLDQIDVKPRKYILAVGRFVPEKGLHDLIETFEGLENNVKLVIAGDADHETEYSKKLKESANNNPKIILTGYMTGEPLIQLYKNAKLFVLPSYHEGLPIVMLEAISYGLPVLASDIPANSEVGLDRSRYFQCGNVSDLKNKLKINLSEGLALQEKEFYHTALQEKYNWDAIARKTVEVYEQAIRR